MFIGLLALLGFIVKKYFDLHGAAAKKYEYVHRRDGGSTTEKDIKAS